MLVAFSATSKTPPAEIERAKRYRKDYLERNDLL